MAIFVVPLATSCTGEPTNESSTETVAETSEPLVNGTPHSESTVGLIVAESGKCTGSLIGRKTALTAAHCVGAGEVVSFCIHPCGNTTNCTGICSFGTAVRYPTYGGNGDWDDDLAVIKLTDDMTTKTTAAFPPKGAQPLLVGGPVQNGEIVTLFGYGANNDGNTSGAGQERFGENSISSVNAQTFECNDASRAHATAGDSGGPATLPSGCEVGMMVGFDGIFSTSYRFNRMDTHANWIQSVAGDTTVRQCENPVCGDGLCQGLESCSTCPSDCTVGCPPPPRCGDGICNGTETKVSCPQDCHAFSCPAGKSDCCDTGVCYTQTACQRLGCL